MGLELDIDLEVFKDRCDIRENLGCLEDVTIVFVGGDVSPRIPVFLNQEGLFPLGVLQLHYPGSKPAYPGPDDDQVICIRARIIGSNSVFFENDLVGHDFLTNRRIDNSAKVPSVRN